MFDIGFFELLIIAIVGLVVIGPERLPETVRSISLWIGRLKRSLRETRSEIERQIGADDIRRQLHNENVLANLEKTRKNIEEVVRAGAEAAQEGGDALSSGLDSLKKDLKDSAEQLTKIEQDLTQHPDYQPHQELPDHAHGEAPSAPDDTDSDSDSAEARHRQP